MVFTFYTAPHSLHIDIFAVVIVARVTTFIVTFRVFSLLIGHQKTAHRAPAMYEGFPAVICGSSSLMVMKENWLI